MFLSQKRKIALSLIIGALIFAFGAFYQYYYLEERTEYERTIAEHYRRSFGKEATPEQLRHLSTLALDRHGPTEIYRIEEDYISLLSALTNP